MEITTHTAANSTTITLAGRLDVHTAPAFKETLTSEIGQGRHNIVVSLAGVEYVDSSGLASLVAGLKNCRRAGGDLKLAALPHPIRLIFEITRLDQAFEIHPDPATAGDSFAA